MGALIFNNFYLFVLAIVLAILEIQIEGQYGWAEKLPTWRPKGNNMFIRLYKKFMSGREATGYHMTIFSFVLLILHLPYAFGIPLHILNWSRTISIFFIFIVLWDFLWFVLNPHHSLKYFSAEHISWHKKWWGGVPRDYYLSLLFSGLVLLPAIWHYDNWYIFYWWLMHICLFFIETVFLVWFSINILKIDNWHKKR